MKTDLSHLRPKKQRELAQAVEILFAEFEDALCLASQKGKKQGRILKIILYGSHARNDWIDSPQTGFVSDYDLLVVVSAHYLTDMAEYWTYAEDRFARMKTINPFRPEVNFILHTMAEINDGLVRGKPFFINIKNEGIALYEVKKGPRFKPAKPLTPELAHEVASDHYEEWFESSTGFMSGFNFYMSQKNWKLAAFMLHQATEHAYTCLSLVLTNHASYIHNIRKLRSSAESLDQRLIEAWPRKLKRHRARFSKLKDAYVKARYSRHYKITKEELEWLGKRVQHLQTLVDIICKEHLETLKVKAAKHD